MKNRGFAVSAALYGMVILFVTIMFCLLNMFKDYRAMNKDFVGSVKTYLNSDEANIIEPTIGSVTNDKATLTDLTDYTTLFKITITINNPNSFVVNQKIRIETPDTIGLNSPVYTANVDLTSITIKSCSGTESACSTETVSYPLISENYNTPTIITTNNNLLAFTSSNTDPKYFEIGPVNLNNGDNTFIFYFRTTSTYTTFYDTDFASKITLTKATLPESPD